MDNKEFAKYKNLLLNVSADEKKIDLLLERMHVVCEKTRLTFDDIFKIVYNGVVMGYIK